MLFCADLSLWVLHVIWWNSKEGEVIQEKLKSSTPCFKTVRIRLAASLNVLESWWTVFRNIRIRLE